MSLSKSVKRIQIGSTKSVIQDYLNLIEFGESLDDWFDISFGKVNTYFNAKHDNKMPRKKNGKIDYYELKEMWLHS